MILSTTLNLPQVDRNLVPHMNNLHGLSGRLRFEMAGEAYVMTFPPNANAVPTVLGLKLEIAGRSMILNVDRAPFLADISARLGDFELADLDMALRKVAVEAGMADVLEAFRQWSGYDGQLEEVRFEACPIPDTFHILNVVAVAENGHSVHGSLGLAVEHLPWFIQLLQDAAPTLANPFQNLGLPADVCIGSMNLNMSEINGLEAGDILLPQTLNQSHEGAQLIVHGGPRLIGRLTDNQFVVEHIMYEEAMESMETDQMELPVRFELGEKRLTLGELQTVQVGTVIELDGPDAAAIVVRAAGQVIAKGELVQVGEHLGVRMLEVRRGNAR